MYNTAQYLNNFKEQLQTLNYSKSTIDNYLSAINRFLNWLKKENLPDIKSLTPQTILNYQTHIQNKNYSLSTQHVFLRGIKHFFTYLTQENQILFNPAAKIHFPKLGNRLPKHIPTEPEMLTILELPRTDTHKGLRDKALLELLYSTGLRRQECANLKIADIDLKDNTVRVNQGKGQKDRIVPLGKTAGEHIKQYILNSREHYLKNTTEESLFLNRMGKPLSAAMITIIIREYRKQAGFNYPFTTHSIRRAFATHLIKNQANPLYVQKLLGHTRGETLNRYVKVAALEVKQTHQQTHPRERGEEEQAC